MPPSYIPDSHTLLWFFWDLNDNLSPKANELMDGMEAQEYHFIIPSIVLLEVMSVCERKKNPGLFPSILSRLAEQENVSFSALDASMVERVPSIPPKYTLHDRIIMATAIHHKAVLITKDRQLKKSKLIQTVW